MDLIFRLCIAFRITDPTKRNMTEGNTLVEANNVNQKVKISGALKCQKKTFLVFRK